jgi:hypothetical protein
MLTPRSKKYPSLCGIKSIQTAWLAFPGFAKTATTSLDLFPLGRRVLAENRA